MTWPGRTWPGGKDVDVAGQDVAKQPGYVPKIELSRNGAVTSNWS